MSSKHAFIPKRLGDRAAFIFFVCFLIAVINFELQTVLPVYHDKFSTWWCIHMFCSMFAAINVFTNLFFMMATDSTTGSASLPSVLKSGWSYCPFCQLNSPPRSFHCHICDTCILKRDHHCIFGGRCVGYKNYRYYIMMVVFLWVGAVYANVYHFEYVHDVAGGFKMATFFTMFMPFVMLIFWVFIGISVLCPLHCRRLSILSPSLHRVALHASRTYHEGTSDLREEKGNHRVRFGTGRKHKGYFRGEMVHCLVESIYTFPIAWRWGSV